MDVTCDRCKTGYEFDDALVSERGTSVRCTQCGHTFKVKRAGAAGTPAAGKETWLVRTIDGRELEFRALRELQAAIGKGLVRRDDVLARENGRPRRLGSIAELDPFFSSRTLTHAQQGTFAKTSIGVGPPRARSHTPPGLGDSASTPAAGTDQSSVRAVAESGPRVSMLSGSTEHSVAFPLAAAVAKHPSDPPPRARAGTRGSLPSASSSPIPGPRAQANSVPFEGSGPPENEDITHPVSRAQLEAAIRAAEQRADESVARALPIPSEPPPRPAPTPSGAGPASEPEVTTSRMKARPPVNTKDLLASTTVDERPALEAEMTSEPEPSISQRSSEVPSSRSHGPEMLPPAPVSGVPVRPATPARPAGAPAPARPAAASAAQDTPDASNLTPTPDTPGDRGSLVDIRPSAMSLINLTPTPADVRYSYVDGTRSSDGRFSAAESRRVGSARWIFALLLVGAVVVGGAVVARRYLGGDGQGAAAKNDEKLVGLLAEAEKALAAGDLETAKEHVDKASGLAERDPRVGELAARIANERAELPWLELRFLASEDPSRPAVKQNLVERIARAKTAGARAAELAPTSPGVIRERIDALRLAGDLEAARALVPQVAAAPADAHAQLVLAALDLAEDSPPFATLIPRLAKAASEEGEGGRARVLLVYALGRSGDVARARTELGRLRATHPLHAPAGQFLDRTDKGVPPSLDIESLPDAQPTGEAGEGEVPGDFRRALEQASKAAAKGDYAKADRLYRGALAKEPGNAEALCGLGHVARARGDGAGAIASYRKSVEAAPGYLPALLPLADMLWDGGNRGEAQGFYRRILELSPTGAIADRARERAGGGAAAPEPSPPATTAEPTAAPTSTPGSTPLENPDLAPSKPPPAPTEGTPP